MFETATALLMRDTAKMFQEPRLRYIYFRILQYYNSLESSQYGGALLTTNPMMHSDVQAL